MNQLFLFRELQGEEELELFFNKRYEGYHNSNKRGILKKGIDLDIDAYDIHSRHYGIFHGNKPAGYIRIILGKSSCYNEQVYRIGLRNNLFSESIHHQQNVCSAKYPEFYFIELFNNQLHTKNGLNDYFNNLSQIVEPSRIVLFDGYKGLNMARFITECALVLYNELCIPLNKNAIISCFQNHAKFYEIYGFKVIQNQLLNPFISDKHDALLILNHAESIATSSIPQNLQPKILGMIDQWGSKGHVTLSPQIS